MFRTLLSPVDGSPSSQHALPFALSIAGRTGATLHVALVHVPTTFGESSSARWDDFDAEAREQEEKYLTTLRTRLSDAPQATVEVHHLEGIVPETLAAEVAQRDVDLVVISAHGWGYISRTVTGSVSDYLMRNLQVPLLVVRASPATPPVVSRQIALRRVLVPLDGSQVAERILRPARELGGLWNAEYRLLRVVSPPRWFFSPWSEQQSAASQGPLGAMRDEATNYLETLAAQFRSSSLAVETSVVVADSPASAILAEANSAKCDLIAIGTHGRGGLPRLLRGSVADKVIRGADTPVLVCNTS